MLPMHEAANLVAELRTERRGKRKIAQLHESRVKAVHIGFSYVLTEPSDAEFVDLNQIHFGSIRERDLSHALPCVWQ